MRRLRLAALTLTSALALAVPARAQQPATIQLLTPTLDGKEPKRPKLPADADTNDARVYYTWGMRDDVPWDKGYNAFYWAYRLEPQAEAYRYAMAEAVYGRQSPQWKEGFWTGADFVHKSKEAKLLDTLYSLVYARDPFVRLTQQCVLDEVLVSYTKEEPEWAAATYFGRGCYKHAAETYAKVLAEKPRYLQARVNRAKSLYWTGDGAGAVKELDLVLAQLRANDAKRTTRFYQSKEFLEVMRGEILESMQDYNGAKQAYQRALEENLASAMAHARLARVALVQGEHDIALQEYDQAIQINDRDPVLHNDYGVALLQLDRFADAEKSFRRAVELEPFFQVARFNLAAAFDKQGKTAEAAEAYRTYVANAPRRPMRETTLARGRLAALNATGAK